MPLATPPRPPPLPADNITHSPRLINFISSHGYCCLSFAMLAVFIAVHLALAPRLFVCRLAYMQRQDSRRNSHRTEKLAAYTARTKLSTLPYQWQYLRSKPIGAEMDDTLREVAINAATPAFEKLLIAKDASITGLPANRSTSLPPLPTAPHAEINGRLDGAGWRFGRHLPPPPPLTPPSRATLPCPLGDGILEHDASLVDGVDAPSGVSFVHQPNPDHAAELDASEIATPTTLLPSAHRQSYTKLVPIGNNVLPASTVPRQPETRSQVIDVTDPHTSTSRPSLAQPRLEIASVSQDGDTVRGIGLRGEIISALHDAGAGWKRHTRVYGGGVCLACLAAEGRSGFPAESESPKDS